MSERGTVIWNAYAAVHMQSEAIKRWQAAILQDCSGFLKERSMVKDTHVTCALLAGMPPGMLTLPRVEDPMNDFKPIKLNFKLDGTMGFQGNALVVRCAPNTDYRVKAALAVHDLLYAIDDKQVGNRPVDVKFNNQAHLTICYVYTTDEAKRGAILDSAIRNRPALMDSFTGELMWKFTKAGRSLIEATGRGSPVSPIPFDMSNKIHRRTPFPYCTECEHYHPDYQKHDYREKENCMFCLDVSCECTPSYIHWKDAIVHSWFSKLVPGLLEGAHIDVRRRSLTNLTLRLPFKDLWLEDRECLSVAFFALTKDERINMIFHEQDDFYAYVDGRFQYLQPVRKFPATDLVLSFVRICTDEHISILRRFDDTFSTISTKNENPSLLPVCGRNHRFPAEGGTIRWGFKDIDFMDGQSIDSSIVMKLGYQQKCVDVMYQRTIRRIDTLCLVRHIVTVNGQSMYDVTSSV